jgi:glycosyltransferase involved in cell wall biosynthesis
MVAVQQEAAVRAMTAPEVSFVVPVCNERRSLEPLVLEIEETARLRGWSYEVLLVNDGSDDGSAETIDRLAALSPAVRGIHLDRNHGQSAAFAAGFARARGNSIVTLDGDGQNDPRDAPALVDLLAEYDLVLGYRTRRADGRVRHLASRIANTVRNRMLGEQVLDVGCSLKAFRAGSVRGLLEFDGMHRFLPSVARMHGLAWAQHPVGHRPRRHGRSKYGIGNRARIALTDLFAVRWMTRRKLRYAIERESGSGRGEVTVAGNDAKIRAILD